MPFCIASTWLRRCLRLAGLCLIPLAASPAVLRSQQATDVQAEVFVNSDLERYLRVLQGQGLADLHPWSIRSFSPKEVRRFAVPDSAHPWSARYELAADSSVDVRLAWVRPEVRLLYNSGFPYGINDGPIWAGRGFTAALQGGFSVEYGPLALVLAPVAFYAQNTDFPLQPVPDSGRPAFADDRYPRAIDLPQRFGDASYSRIDPGESTLRLDAFGVATGISTASQHWGPAAEYPLLLGNNAGGFPHLFLGTARPVDLWLGKVHGRLVWGRLSQSDYSPVQSGSGLRFMSGLVGVFSPRGVDGLELGAARFFHTPWPEQGLEASNFLKPLEGFLKGGLADTGQGVDGRSDVDNQLASVFGRWVLPRSGFEVYGEFAREDHSYDLRDFLLEPDHDSGYMFGFLKSWRGMGDDLIALRGEVMNTQITHLSLVRDQVPFYIHAATLQGHTQRGQILGAAVGYGGSGTSLAADYYHPDGRWTLAWSRTRQGEHPVADSVSGTTSLTSEVLHTLGGEAVFFRGRTEIASGLTAGYEFNRQDSSDAFNLNASIRLRVRF